MRALVWIVTVAAVLWGGYWFIGARAAEQGAERALAEAGARGITVTHEGLGVAGFPNRFDLTLTAPTVSLPGLAWQAPVAQVFALSYAPWNLIAALPDQQSLTLAGQAIDLRSSRMQGSVFLTPGPALSLRDFKAVAEAVSLRSDAGWSLGFGSANLSLVPGEGRQAQAAARMLDLVPDQRLAAAVAGAGLPAVIERLDLLADLTLDAPLALRGAPAALQVVDLSEAHLHWGPLRLTAKGRLTAGPQGLAEGRIDLRVEGWQVGLAAAEAAGLVPDRFRTALRSVLQGLAAQSAEPGVLHLPLVMQRGRMMLGPVPLGAAPRLREG